MGCECFWLLKYGPPEIKFGKHWYRHFKSQSPFLSVDTERWMRGGRLMPGAQNLMKEFLEVCIIKWDMDFCDSFFFKTAFLYSRILSDFSGIFSGVVSVPLPLCFSGRIVFWAAAFAFVFLMDWDCGISIQMDFGLLDRGFWKAHGAFSFLYCSRSVRAAVHWQFARRFFGGLPVAWHSFTMHSIFAICGGDARFYETVSEEKE